jgi:two-component system response regulator FixJ
VIVDDEPGIRMMLSLLLDSAGIPNRAYESGERFLKAFSAGGLEVGCLVLDLALSGVGGLEVLSKTRRQSSDLPVIIISGTASFADAAHAIQGKANAVFAKPFNPGALLASIQSLMAEWRERSAVRRDISTKLAMLSPREREVLDALVEGKNTSQIAHALGISPSTVEKHRLRVFDKTGIDSVVGLVHWLFGLK